MNSSINKIITLFLAVFIFFLILELAGRLTENLYYYSSNVHFSIPGESKLFRVSPTPGLGYDLKPNNDVVVNNELYVSTNSKGIRDIEYDIKKPKDTYRIVIIGDSTAYGDNVNAEERFSNILNDLLNFNSTFNSTIKYEVINAAIPGYNAIQKLILFKVRILEYEPDLVIYQFANDDYWKNSISNIESAKFDPNNAERLFAMNMPKVLPVPRILNVFLLEKSSIYRYLNIYIYNILSKIDPVKYYPNAYKFLEGLDAVELNRNAIINFEKLSKENSFDFFVVLTPTLVNTDVNDGWIRNEANDYFQIKTLDIFSELKTQEIDLTSLRVFPSDNTHPSPNGHNLFAKEIYQYINENAILNS